MQSCRAQITRPAIIPALIVLLTFLPMIAAAQYYKGAPAYHDTTYYSKVFGHKKFYRIYLPKGYNTAVNRYPVIYYFHGWGGRYYSDENAKLAYDKIKGVVDKYQVILVMVDGNIATAEPRPYNVGYHDDVKFQVQMKDYFPELVAHIDSVYRTLPDRQHRGIIGFSMGGFISFYLAGKYPDKVCAAVSLAGSPEFFVGYPSDHTLYSMRYTFINLRQVDVAMRNGDSDILYYLNREVLAGAHWDEKVKLQYWSFPGPHMVDKPGETKVYEKAVKFVTDAFGKSTDEKNISGWSHYDLYPDFEVWGYQVRSDKHTPGFLLLRNTDAKGFGFYTQRWLPDGSPLEGLHARITTAPLYKAGKEYGLIKYDQATGRIITGKVYADKDGSITIPFDGWGEAGIFAPDDTPEYVFLDDSIIVKSSAGRYLKEGTDNQLMIRLFNRGGEDQLPGDIRVEISTTDTSVHFTDSTVIVKAIKGQRILSLPSFTLSCSKQPPPHAEPADIRFHLTIHAPWEVYKNEFTIPVFFQAPVFDSIKVDDGRMVRDTVAGEGNGDGIADAGERIMLYQGNHRLRLYTDDPWMLSTKEQLADEIIPARWPDGYTLSSVVQLSPDCPDGHVIEFLASYETKTFNPIERKVTWGRVKLLVRHH